jgi:hypothetical protein
MAATIVHATLTEDEDVLLKALSPLAGTKAPIIGPWHWCDYGITHYPLEPRLVFSGVIAQWCGYLMGAHPLILAGFDCYGGTHRSMGQHKEYAPHLKCEIRVASGPLIGTWPKYDPAETFPEYVPPEVFIETEHGVKVRVVKPVEIRGLQYPVGTVLQVPRAEVWRQINDAVAIRPDEVDTAWMYRIGVPVPMAGVTTETPEGRVRRITMGKGIHFNQRITAWVPGRYMHFTYDFQPDSFPPRDTSTDWRDTSATVCARSAVCLTVVRTSSTVVMV